jgi:hypothetical protein
MGGNAAVTALLQGPVAVQRDCGCGGICGSCEENTSDPPVQALAETLTIQRDDETTPTVCDPSIASCPPGTVAPDGTPNTPSDASTPAAATPAASTPADAGPAADTGPAPNSSQVPDVGASQSTPAVCDPSVASCPPGTVDPNGNPNPGTVDPNANPNPETATPSPDGSADPCFANFDVTSASAVDKLTAAICCSQGKIPEEIYNNLVGAVGTMVVVTIVFAAIQFVPGVDAVVDGVTVLELIKAAVEAGLNYEMAKSIAEETEKFLNAVNATSNEEIKAAGDALASAVGQSSVFVLMLLIGGEGGKGEPPVEPIPDGEYPAVPEKGKLLPITVDSEAPKGAEGAGDTPTPPTQSEAPKGPEGGAGDTPTPPTQSEAQMSDGSPVAGEAESPDGAAEVKVGQDGKCEVCASPCKDVREKYSDVLTANPDLEARLAAAEGMTDLGQKANAVAQLIPDLESASKRRGSELSGVAKSLVDDPEACKELNWKSQAHDHHIYSKTFRADFARIKINVDDFCVTIMADEHIGDNGIHKILDWNGEWEDFFNEMPDRDLSDAEIAKWQKKAQELVADLLDRAGMSGLPIHPYGG